jgi:hypothetical protein
VDKQSPSRQRFPRYHSGSQAAALSNLWQTKARFEVQLHPETKSLAFVYSFPAPANIPPDCESLYDALFGIYRVELEKRLQKALETREFGRRRPAPNYIDKFHHHAIQDGMSGWFRELYQSIPKDFPAAVETAKNENEKFVALAPKRSGPDAQLALIVLERVSQVLASVKLLRNTVDPSLQDRLDETALIAEIKKSGLRLEAVQAAVQELLNDPEVRSVKAIIGDSFTDKVMTHSIVQSELALDKRNPLKISVRTYVRKAKQLLNALRDSAQSKITPEKES